MAEKRQSFVKNINQKQIVEDYKTRVKKIEFQRSQKRFNIWESKIKTPKRKKRKKGIYLNFFKIKR